MFSVFLLQKNNFISFFSLGMFSVFIVKFCEFFFFCVCVCMLFTKSKVYIFFVLPTQILCFFMKTVFYEVITRSRKADSTKMLFLKALGEDVILK